MRTGSPWYGALPSAAHPPFPQTVPSPALRTSGPCGGRGREGYQVDTKHYRLVGPGEYIQPAWRPAALGIRVEFRVKERNRRREPAGDSGSLLLEPQQAGRSGRATTIPKREISAPFQFSQHSKGAWCEPSFVCRCPSFVCCFENLAPMRSAAAAGAAEVKSVRSAAAAGAAEVKSVLVFAVNGGRVNWCTRQVEAAIRSLQL